MEDKELTQEEKLLLEEATKVYGSPKYYPTLSSSDVDLAALEKQLQFYILNKMNIKFKLNNGQIFSGVPKEIICLDYKERDYDF